MNTITLLLHNLDDLSWRDYGPRIVMIEIDGFRLRYFYDDFYVGAHPEVGVGGFCMQVQMSAIKNQPNWEKSSLFLERKIENI